MEEYIDKETAIKEVNYCFSLNPNGAYAAKVKRIIDAIPTADVRENKRGKWTKCEKDARGYSDTFECSECECLVTYAYYVQDIDYDFCPHCGAKMEGE